MERMREIIEIGVRIKQERERLGLLQETFGSIARVTKKSQINYEKGIRKPDSEYLFNLHQFGVDVFYILTGNKNAQTLGIEEDDLITQWRKASIPVKAAALAVLNSYSNPASGNTIGNNSSGNAQINNSPNTTVIHKPNRVHITAEQKQHLTKQVKKIVKKSKTTSSPLNYHTIWIGLNKHCGVSSYGLIEFDDYKKAEAYLEQQYKKV